jgi:hypothetical protein
MKVVLDFAISGNTVLVVADGVISSDLNGEVVILNMKDGTYYGLGEVGHRVWELLREPVSVRNIHSVILNEYDVEPEQCEMDLLMLIESLLEQGLIEVNGESGS